MRASSRKNVKAIPARRPAAYTAADLPLRGHAERALSDYFANLNGHRPARLYDLVLREVEEPLFRTVLDHVGGNQSQAAIILGLNRGTLRKKLREFGLSA
jgi:Fis family transcriptional regulator, factor for inversion stimulation protein